MKVASGFGMNGDDGGPGVDVVIDVPFRVFDHQMYVKGQFRDFSECFDNRWANGQVRDKVPVHNIHMNPVGTGRFQTFNIFAQFGKVSRKNRRSN